MNAFTEVEFPQTGPGYLDLARVDRSLHEAALVWVIRNIRMYEEDRALDAPRLAATLVSLPSDQSFQTYESALRHVMGPRLADDVELYWRQGMLDVLLEYGIQSESSRFAVEMGFTRLALRVTVALRMLTPDGSERAFELHDEPGLVRLDPQWHQAVARFVRDGFFHILDGIDHLLFLFCLVIPFRRIGPLIGVVTAFTVAHSVTLIASAYGLAPSELWFVPLVETLIAASIVFMALENIVGSNAQRQWIVAFGFCLYHASGLLV